MDEMRHDICHRSSVFRGLRHGLRNIGRAFGRYGLRALVACALFSCVALGFAANDVERMQQFVLRQFGAEGVRNLHDWRATLTKANTVSESDKLRLVNDFFNRRIQFQEDIVVWNQLDYWATPLETLGKGAGDCEDFAIAKYFSLIELGVPASRLRLTYVRARIGAATSTITQAHMVVSYYAQPEVEPLIMDNLITDIRPASRRPDLTPVFSFNGEGVWMAGADRPASPIDRLSRWTDVLIRMKAEGYEP